MVCCRVQAGAFAEFLNSYMQEKQEEGGLEDIDDDSECSHIVSTIFYFSLFLAQLHLKDAIS